MIKYKKHITYEMERYPEKCKECPAFRQTPYTCHNERGMEAHCELGFMDGKDMRDFNGNERLSNCYIRFDSRVKIMTKEEKIFYYELCYFHSRKDSGSLYVKSDKNLKDFLGEDEFLNYLMKIKEITYHEAQSIIEIIEITEMEYEDFQ